MIDLINSIDTMSSLQYFLCYSKGIQIFQDNGIKSIMDLDSFDYSFIQKENGLYISNHNGLQLLIPKIHKWTVNENNDYLEINNNNNKIFIKRKT